MLCIVIPAHNEEQRIGACLRAALDAGRHPTLAGESVRVVVALDSCADRTRAIVREFDVEVVRIAARNVGVARAAGAQRALAMGARWLAFTDADTHVAGDWLVQQLALQADVVCGAVSVEDWTPHVDAVQKHFACTYFAVDGHRHIHGANLGVSADAYRRVGGFAPLPVSEDVALVEALVGSGAHVVWSGAPKVVTSARTDFRAVGGFGDTLLRVSQLHLNGVSAASDREDDALAA
jgi:glycosyltransferase involved in cell wall biosynthesis